MDSTIETRRKSNWLNHRSVTHHTIWSPPSKRTKGSVGCDSRQRSLNRKCSRCSKWPKKACQADSRYPPGPPVTKAILRSSDTSPRRNKPRLAVRFTSNPPLERAAIDHTWAAIRAILAPRKFDRISTVMRGFDRIPGPIGQNVSEDVSQGCARLSKCKPSCAFNQDCLTYFFETSIATSVGM